MPSRLSQVEHARTSFVPDVLLPSCQEQPKRLSHLGDFHKESFAFAPGESGTEVRDRLERLYRLF